MSDAHGLLKKLLRGERAAVESYRDALEDVEGEGAEPILRRMLDHHREAVAQLEKQVSREGEDPGDGSGPWGAFSRAVESVASWIGDPGALRALQEGETHGVAEYRTALADEDLPAEARNLIQNRLLPRQEQHVARLDELIRRAEQAEKDETLQDRIEERG